MLFLLLFLTVTTLFFVMTMFVAVIVIPTVVYLAVRTYRFKQLPKETIDGFITSIWDSRKYKLPGVILHRGGAIDTPENTLEALQQAKRNGCCGVEIDLDFTKDNIGILLHDSTVDRTTDGYGVITEMMYEDVKKLNAAAKHKNSEKLGHIKIPTLEESLDLCLELDLKIFIDCKGDAQKTADLVCKLYSEKPTLYKSAVVCSFYPQVLYAVRKKDMAIMTALTYRDRFISTAAGVPRFEGWKQAISYPADILLNVAHATVLWYFFGNSFFLLNKDNISSKVMKKWKNRNIHLIAWTVNHPVEKKYLLNYQQCPIITDGLDSES